MVVHIGIVHGCRLGTGDGKWMYFGVDVNGSRHLWRQQFPDGQPEQITFDPTEEDGVAVAPDGRSLITSIGIRQSAVWIHDARGDRPLSSQGYVPHVESTGRSRTMPVFSRDGQSLFYLRSESPGAPTEVWRADVASEKSEKALPGISMVEFDVSHGAKEVVYSVQPPGKASAGCSRIGCTPASSIFPSSVWRDGETSSRS